MGKAASDDVCGKILAVQHTVDWQDEQRWLLNLLSILNTLRTPAAALSFLGSSLSVCAVGKAGNALLPNSLETPAGVTTGGDPLHGHLLLSYSSVPGNVSVMMGFAYLNGKCLKSFDF